MTLNDRLLWSNKLSITAIFRDESKFLDEWIRFHLHQGVSQFFLFDDGSTDNPELVLDRWIRRGVVVLRTAHPHGQQATYDMSLKSNRFRTRWMAFIDIDEFLFSPAGKKLTWILKDFDDATGVFVFWTLFGTSGHVTPPAKSVLESYTWALPWPRSRAELEANITKHKEIRGDSVLTGGPLNGKSIVNPRKVFRMGALFPHRYSGELKDEAGRVLPKPFRIAHLADGYLPTNGRLRLNHYWSKSEEDLRRKAAGRIVSESLRRDSPGKKRDFTRSHAWAQHLNWEQDFTLLRQWRSVTSPYVFIIGFNKTATRALSKFFQSNGMPAVHWDKNRLVERMMINLGEGRKIFDGYDVRYRVFSDLIFMSSEKKIEGNQFFREMSRDYPGAFFLLNNRNTEDWVRSRALHADGEFLRQQLRILGSDNSEDAFTLWRQEKSEHENEVRAFFGNSDSFLEVDIASNDIPSRLEDFLQMEMDVSQWRHIGQTKASTE